MVDVGCRKARESEATEIMKRVAWGQEKAIEVQKTGREERGKGKIGKVVQTKLNKVMGVTHVT